MELSRRSVLKTSAVVAGFGAIGGCLSEPDLESNADGGYAAFFTLWDWAEQITGDEMEFDNPIPTGEMGHGYEPPGDVQRDIATSAAFVYLDTSEFAWAQDVAADFERDGSDITLIDGMDGLEGHLLPMSRDGDDDREPDRDHDWDPSTVSIEEFEVYDRRTGEEVAYFHGDHWHGGLPDIGVGDTIESTAMFEDDAGRVLPLGDDEPFRFDARVTDGASEDVVEIESRGDVVEFDGVEEGRTRIVFELVADGDVVWDSSDDNMPVVVTDDPEETKGPTSPDPHVWVDPVIAQDIVDTIAEGLADVDPDNADLYRENADAYNERLAAVDQQFEELAAEAERDVAIFAGHGSFQYLEYRYGFELHTPVGISPDESEDLQSNPEMIELIDDHGIDTILYDPFESPNPGEDLPDTVELLINDTDASDSAPITPAEGTTPEWNEQGWGWIEQMEEVTIPSLRKALGAQ